MTWKFIYVANVWMIRAMMMCKWRQDRVYPFEVTSEISDFHIITICKRIRRSRRLTLKVTSREFQKTFSLILSDSHGIFIHLPDGHFTNKPQKSIFLISTLFMNFRHCFIRKIALAFMIIRRCQKLCEWIIASTEQEIAWNAWKHCCGQHLLDTPAEKKEIFVQFFQPNN